MKIIKSSEGFALFIAILVMAIVMLFLGASFFLSRVEMKITSNFKLGTQALGVADTGLLHALKVLEPQKGWDFNDSFTCQTPPCDVISNSSFPSAPGFTYSVTVENDALDIANGGSASDDTDSLVVLISTANGPNDTKRQVQAYVKRSSVDFTTPGAVYLPASSANIDFSVANNPGMFITGDDTSYTDSNSDGWADSTEPASPVKQVKGVATIADINGNDPVGDSFKTALISSSLNGLVQGDGYSSPNTPSVSITTDQIDVNQIALNLFNHAGTVQDLDGEHKTCSSSSPCIYGTDASPQITYIREGASHIHLDGYVTGSGVLATEGKTHLYGNFEFHGLVIAVKEGLTTQVPVPETVSSDYFSLRNDARVFGAVLLGPKDSALGFEMQDNAKVYYNSDAINMAESLCGECFPQSPSVFAWIDK